MHIRFLIIMFLLILGLENCNSKKKQPEEVKIEGPQRFELLSPEKTGITFSNAVNEDYHLNILNYEYLYNGGGVAIGDINNDGLPDVYFTSTFGSNKLYLNKGGLKFEDITDRAGVAGKEGFKTGVTMADVNADGFLDIYVCRTSKDSMAVKSNLLFINNGNTTFTEKGAEYNLAGNQNTNHAVFFDYDGDSDLDMFEMNHRVNFAEATTMRLMQMPGGKIIRRTNPMTSFESDRLFRNDGNKFVDISKSAGISSSAFSLGATVADVNLDNAPDIYVTNDYIEPDQLFINNKKAGFTDKASDYFKHTAQNSMGNDVADYNNDGLPDIISLDMIAEDPFRYKQLMNAMQYERYSSLLKFGYGHQVSRNMLQLNNGNNTFSEIGQLAGISNTDWSWGATFADYDNDGWKDIFITNGYRRDVTDNDYMVYTRDSIELSGGINTSRFPDINQFLSLIPERKLPNYMYHSKADLSFENATAAWGMKQESFSNGSAYADLDADGDLDLVINNIADPAFVYENKTVQQGDRNFLQIKLTGPEKNKFGLGTKVWLFNKGQMQYQELYTNRGFMSSCDPLIHFGTGPEKTIERVEIRWPDGKTQILSNIKANQRLNINYKDAGNQALTGLPVYTPLFTDVSKQSGINFLYSDSLFVDFNNERLIPHKFSNQGPMINKGDANGDGKEDIYIGGSTGQAGALYLQGANGNFTIKPTIDFVKDKGYEDSDAVFFDSDGDKDLDLFVTSGSNEGPIGSNVYQCRLYLNDGKANYTRSTVALPDIRTSAGCTVAFDIDNDKDLDLLIGGKVTPGSYPTTPESFILINDKGKFTDGTSQWAPDFKKIGMVYSVITGDLDNDKQEEIIVAGEWMPITVFKKKGNSYVNATKDYGFDGTNGWWNSVALIDGDKDGDLDLVGGNLGLNTRIRATPEKPVALFSKDFDNNGSLDPVMAFTYKGEFVPYVQRDLLAKQIRSIKKKFPRYRAYSNATMKDLFGSDLSSAEKYTATCLTTSYFENNKGKFTRRDLPLLAQFSPVKCILTDDFNNDGINDILLAGNNSGADTETGIYDASTGLILQGDGKGNFKPLISREAGIWFDKEARDMAIIKDGKKKRIICTNNDGPVQVFAQK